MKKRFLVALGMFAAIIASLYGWKLYKYYQRSSDPVYMADACVGEAMHANETGNYQKAFEVCADAAFLADLEMKGMEIDGEKVKTYKQEFFDAAFTALGRMYMEGRGANPDPVKGLHWLTKAADRHLPAAHYLYEMYAYGNESLGIKRNPYVAAKWLRKSAELGDNESMFLLGVTFAHGGRGVKKDLNEAAKWLYKCGLAWLDAADANLDLEFEPNPAMADESLAKAQKCLESLKKLKPNKYRIFLANDLEQKIRKFKVEERDAYPEYSRNKADANTKVRPVALDRRFAGMRGCPGIGAGGCELARSSLEASCAGRRRGKVRTTGKGLADAPTKKHLVRTFASRGQTSILTTCEESSFPGYISGKG